MTTLHALIEEWPNECGVYVHELPGVFVGDESLAATLEVLPDTIEAHLSWLASHGFDVRPYAGADVEVSEERVAIEGRRGPLFEADRSIPSPDDIDQALSVAALARRDLIDLYRSVSDVRRDRSPATGGWSIAEHLRHIAEAEAYYADTLVESPLDGLPHDPIQAMHVSAEHADAILRTLSGDDHLRVARRDGEEWTTTKVLRRMTGHLREHYPWVRDIARS